MDDETRTRMAALNITARFEGRSYRTYRHNDPGIISYGRFNFTLDSDALAQLVQCYTAQSKTPVAVDLRAYQIRLDAADETLNSDELLHGLLVRAASDPIMQQCQDDEATTRFWDPIQRIAVLPRSLQCPLSWALLFDIGICYGIGDGLLRIAEAEFGVPPRAHIADFESERGTLNHPHSRTLQTGHRPSGISRESPWNT